MYIIIISCHVLFLRVVEDIPVQSANDDERKHEQ